MNIKDQQRRRKEENEGREKNAKQVHGRRREKTRSFTYHFRAHGAARFERQLVQHRTDLLPELRHTRGVLGEPLRINHTVEGIVGFDGDDDVIAVTQNADTLDRHLLGCGEEEKEVLMVT